MIHKKIKKAIIPIGPVVNRVPDTFSTIQYMTICCLCHANIIMLSAIWVELSNSRVAPSQVPKMSHRTPDPLYTHMWRIGHETTPKFVIPISIWGTLACLVTVKLEEHLASSLSSPCSSLSQSLSAPSFHDYFLICGTVCVNCFTDQLA